jgi:large subunit ribosomal protein L3
MKFILGTKQRMTQIFDSEGKVHPVTVIKIAPLTVTQVKTDKTDGYSATQIGFGEKKAKRINKALKGHMKDLGNFRHLKEVKGLSEKNVGDVIQSEFVAGDIVEVSATSKSKGFQGVVKRHNFAGGRRSHGQKHSEREPGSIGAGGYQRVFKGRRMAGRMGGERVTVKNLIVMNHDVDNNEIMIRGAVPGRKGTLVEVRG